MKKIFFVCGLLLSQIVLFSQNARNVHGVQNVKDATDSVWMLKLDSIVVQGNRATSKTPVPYTEISKEELKRVNPSGSMPALLNLQPSVVSFNEGGTGLGNSKLSVRGSDPTRVNVTINGVAMNDSESQEVFWVNIPAIGSFLNSVQLQRGIGTSMNGAGAFGASLNMQTQFTSIKAYGEVESSFGSYNTFINSIGVGTGRLKSGLSFDLRFNHSTTDGYIRNAKADVTSLFASLGYHKNRNSFRLNYIFGDQVSGITWEGISKEELEKDRRTNPAGAYYDEMGNLYYYDNETDNYQQHYLQFLYALQVSPFLNWTTTLNYTKGDGYYENYKANKEFSLYGLDPVNIGGVNYIKSDFIIRQHMDNNYYVGTTMFKLLGIRGESNLGASYSFYTGDHFGDVLWSKHDSGIDDFRWYKNNGEKHDMNVFIRTEQDITYNLSLYADLQYRHVNYSLSGMDKDSAMLDKSNKYHFFNPKAGLNLDINDYNRLYVSFATGHKEPSRSDIKEAIKAGRADEMKAERMFDYELGYLYSSEKLSLGVNLYMMEYKNQLVHTGKISETGYGIKENVPVSYRRGIELSFAWEFIKSLRFDLNTTFSKNKIKGYTEWVDTYGPAWEEYQTSVYYDKTNISMSPEIIGMAGLTYTPRRDMLFSINGKYVGKQYYDNTSSEDRVLPAYFVMGLNATKSFKIKSGSFMDISLFVDNLLNNRYVASAWVWRSIYWDGTPAYLEEGFFPQAEINFMLKLAFRF